MMKKVLIVVNYMNMGGIENFVMNIVRNIDKSNFSIDFLYSDGRKSYFDDEIKSLDCNIYMITGRSANLKKHFSELKSFFKEHNDYSAVHINYDNATCFTVARAAKKAGIKNVIVHSHNSKANNSKIHKICKPIMCRYTDKYWSCSDLASEWMFTKKINNSGKVLLVKNAIDTEKYRYDAEKRKSIRTELSISEDCFVVGHIGRFNVQKNHKFLIDVFCEFLKINNNSKLLLLGTGELLDDMKSYANEKGIAESVIFAGVRDDVPSVLSVMDCFVMPSLFEGLPVTLVEAQASGLKVLTSDIITRDVDISDLIEYYPLEKSALDWSQKIMANTDDREKYVDVVKNSGFDVKEEVKILESQY